VTAGEASGDAQQLRAEIERTREHLGATVEELAAKVDVKKRAQAKATDLTRQAKWQARSVVAQTRKLAARTGKQAAQAGKQVSLKGADTARQNRGPLSAGAGAAGLLAAIALLVWLRRKR
jgi:hypothetical protein